ncbi:MAG TPA: hypothetical protein VFZ81_01770, partial [Burkholderiales bacterium]
MKRSNKIAAGAVAALGLGLAVAAFAHGPMAGMHSGDAAFQADMQLVHEMLAGHDRIRRAVENL